jgi:hypothetical protein
VRTATEIKFSDEEISDLMIWKYDFDMPIIFVLNRTAAEEEEDIRETWEEIFSKEEKLKVRSNK